jgi:hypothetical protein
VESGQRVYLERYTRGTETEPKDSQSLVRVGWSSLDRSAIGPPVRLSQGSVVSVSEDRAVRPMIVGKSDVRASSGLRWEG